jgi:futalosine hydrolase
MGSQPGVSAGRVLLAVAAPGEARAVLAGLGADAGLASREWEGLELDQRFDLVVTGVGKSNAAGAVGQVLAGGRHRMVVNIGICGALAGRAGGAGLRIGSVVAATASVFADEGVGGDGEFVEMSKLGFAPMPGAGEAMAVDAAMLEALGLLADASGPIATVSTCSGTDALAGEIVRRTGAIAEAMEGAAVGLVAHRLGVAFGELRVVSNTTGSRTRQVWDLKGAMARLSDVASRLPGALALRTGRPGEG